MTEIFIKIIEQLNSSVFVLLCVLIAIGYMLLKFGEWKQKFVNQDNRLAGVENISAKVIRLETKIDLIYQNTNPNKLVVSQSPLNLTDKGRDISKKIKAEEMFEKYRTKLKSEVNKSDPKNAYDIQTASMETSKKFFVKMLNDDELVKIKQTAFDEGLLVEDIMSIFGVLLRNAILEEKQKSWLAVVRRRSRGKLRFFCGFL